VADYDVIIVGAGLGGLSTGALAAKEGFKTLILEQSDIIGGCCSTFEVDGYKFDVGASIVEVIQPLDRLFEMLGGKRSDYMDLIPCDPIYSFITDDGKRFSYPTDIGACTEVIKDIAPGDVAGWNSFCSMGLSMIEDMMDAVMLSPMNTFGEAVKVAAKNPQIIKFAPTFLRTHQGVVRSFYKDPARAREPPLMGDKGDGELRGVHPRADDNARPRLQTRSRRASHLLLHDSRGDELDLVRGLLPEETPGPRVHVHLVAHAR
jgi:phytoene dehydrogenase-like protein